MKMTPPSGKRALLPWVVLTFCLLAACGRMPLSPPVAEQGTDGARWEAYVRSGAEAQSPYRLSLSLRFGLEGDTRRVTALLWGNDGKRLRLDVSAGVGAMLAMLSENGDEFLAYAPRENTVFFHNGANRPLLRIGVPVPFGLSALAELLRGRFAAVFGDAFVAVAPGRTPGSLEYALAGRQGGLLTLDRQGRPERWRESAEKGKGWSMDFFYADDNLLRSLSLEHGNGQKAVVLIRDREAPSAFSNEQLELHFPDSVRILPLEQFRRRP